MVIDSIFDIHYVALDVQDYYSQATPSLPFTQTMRNEYPYNRMQEKKLKRFERPFYIAMGFAFALAGAMTFTPHTYAKSIELVNTMHDSVETVNDKILSVSPSLTDETVSFLAMSI